MDGNFKIEVMCCFCGESVDIKDSFVLAIFPDLESEESQGLYCHKKCFLGKMHKSVVLHPDMINDK